MTSNVPEEIPEEGKAGKAIRGALQVAGGAVPVVGGILSAIAGAWSEREQAKVNQFFDQCPEGPSTRSLGSGVDQDGERDGAQRRSGRRS